MYRPLKITKRSQPKYHSSFMAKRGVNTVDYEQVMDINYAMSIVNYIPTKYGLEKRKGLEKIFEKVGAGASFIKEFTSGVWVFGHENTIEAYNANTDTFTVIKNDFSENLGFNGARYGEYFLIVNGVDSVWLIDSSLNIAEIPDSPVFDGIKVIGSRVYGWKGNQIKYSEVDTGANPPFQDWVETTAADKAGMASYRNAGSIRSVCALGQYVVCFGDKGFFAFFINTVDSAGTLKKVEVIQNYTEDHGGATGAIETPFGLFYLNESGLKQMVSVGVTNEPMSRQELKVTEVINPKYFEGIDQTSVDIVHDMNQKCIFVTCAKNSNFNNKVFGIKLDLNNAFFEINGWNIRKFAVSGDRIFGISSVKNAFYELFKGHHDDGLKIGTYYLQEIPLGTLFEKHALYELYAGGFLSPSTNNTVSFDYYDIEGKIHTNKEQYEWVADGTNGTYNEWNNAPWVSPYGGSQNTSGMIESFGGGSPRIQNLQRLRVKISGGDMLPQIINWIVVKTERKGVILRRNMRKL